MMSVFELVVFFYLLDPQVSVEVNNLGSDNFSVRQKSHKKLSDMDKRAMLHVVVAKCNHHDAEVRKRCRELSSKYFNEIVFSDRMPWIDCLPKDFPNREETIEKYYQEFNHRLQDTNNDAEHLRDATQLFSRRLLEKGWLPKQINELITDMNHNENQWVSERGSRLSSPPEFRK